MLTALPALLLLAGVATAAPRRAAPFSLETDVLVDVFDGISVQLRRDHTLVDHLAVGLAVMRIDIPPYMLDEYNGADPDAWDQIRQIGGRVMLDYHLFEPDAGLCLGAYVTFDTYRMAREGDAARMWHVGEGVRVGYRWRPGRGRAYVFPALAAYHTQKVAGDDVVAGLRFDANVVAPQVMVHIGYTFGRECPRCSRPTDP